MPLNVKKKKEKDKKEGVFILMQLCQALGDIL